MPSSHPLTTIKSSWRWLTTNNRKNKPKTHQAPIQNDLKTNTNNSNNNDNNKINKKAMNLDSDKTSSYHTHPPHLPKPEPAVHRLQELKSPPPIPLPPSETGPDSPGFKSRPLYRRTHSTPARDLAEGEEGGGQPGGMEASVALKETAGPGELYVEGSDGGRKVCERKESEGEGGWGSYEGGGAGGSEGGR